MAADALDLIRHEWEEGARRLESERGDRRRYERLLAQTAAIVDELRRRVGQTYSLGELADVYRDADRWARSTIEEQAAAPGWPRDLALVLAAAFHAYQRGALDYAS
jgi:hypothetical protein